MKAGRRPWRTAVVLMVMAGLAGVRASPGAMRDGFQGPEGGRRVVRLHADKTTGGVDATELLFAGVKKGALQALNVTERNVDLSALPTAANIQVGAAANVVQKHPAVKRAVESIADLPLYKIIPLGNAFVDTVAKSYGPKYARVCKLRLNADVLYWISKSVASAALPYGAASPLNDVAFSLLQASFVP